MAGLVPPNAGKTPITWSEFMFSTLRADTLLHEERLRQWVLSSLGQKWLQGHVTATLLPKGRRWKGGAAWLFTVVCSRATRYCRHELKPEVFRLGDKTSLPRRQARGWTEGQAAQGGWAGSIPRTGWAKP